MANPWHYLSIAQRALWAWDLQTAKHYADMSLKSFPEIEYAGPVLSDEDPKVSGQQDRRLGMLLDRIYERVHNNSGRSVDIEALDHVEGGIRACKNIMDRIEYKLRNLEGVSGQGFGQNDNGLRLAAIIARENYQIQIRGYVVGSDVWHFEKVLGRISDIESDGEIHPVYIQIDDNTYKSNVICDTDYNAIMLSLYYQERIIKMTCIRRPWFFLVANIDTGLEDSNVLDNIAQDAMRFIQSIFL